MLTIYHHHHLSSSFHQEDRVATVSFHHLDPGWSALPPPRTCEWSWALHLGFSAMLLLTALSCVCHGSSIQGLSAWYWAGPCAGYVQSTSIYALLWCKQWVSAAFFATDLPLYAQKLPQVAVNKTCNLCSNFFVRLYICAPYSNTDLTFVSNSLSFVFKYMFFISPDWFESSEGMACFSNPSLNILVCSSCLTNNTSKVGKLVYILKRLPSNENTRIVSWFTLTLVVLVFSMFISRPVDLEVVRAKTTYVGTSETEVPHHLQNPSPLAFASISIGYLMAVASDHGQ